MNRLIRPVAISVLAMTLASGAGASTVPGAESGDTYNRLQRHSTQAEAEHGWPDQPGLVTHTVSPDVADPSVRRYLRDNIVAFRRDRVQPDAPLFLYLVGTGGAPDNGKLIAATAAAQGYRVVDLMYDDMPATAQACDHDPDPACAARFRQKRTFGDNVTDDIADQPQESVVRRLVALLGYLDHRYPKEGWGGYLRSGAVDWGRVAVSGHSQGAGIAAFIAKRFAVNRVVLFSSPWDYYHVDQGGHDARVSAPWLSAPSATPADRWYGAYHAREPQAQMIAQAYDRLKIPSGHVRVFTLAPKGSHSEHGSVSGDAGTPRLADGSPAYLPEWQFLIGSAG